MEGKEWIWNNGHFTEAALDEIVPIISETELTIKSKKEKEIRYIEAFNKFLSSL